MTNNSTELNEQCEENEERRQCKDASKDEDDDEDDGDEEEEGDHFFESFDRVPSGISFEPEFPSSGSDSDQDEMDARISFASAVLGPYNIQEEQDLSEMEGSGIEEFDYNLWMEQPMSVQERRRRLLQGMGLNSGRRSSGILERVISQRVLSSRQPSKKLNSSPSPSPSPSSFPLPSPSPSPSPAKKPVITRCGSDSHLSMRAKSSRPSLSRVYSSPPSLLDRSGPAVVKNKLHKGEDGNGGESKRDEDDGMVGSICRIKNLDTGKEFVVSEFADDGKWDRLNDIQTGLQLTLDEFEKFLGYSPIVKQLMQRPNGSSPKSFEIKNSKSSTTHKKKGNGWLKNIKFVASSVTGLIMEKDKLGSSKTNAGSLQRLTSGSTADKTKAGTNERLKVHQYGKSYKELTGLYMCQEVKAHDGSIWCMKFCNDGKYLASAGEDRVIHVWGVSISESNSFSMSFRRDDARNSGPLNNQSINGSQENNAGSLSTRQLSGRKTSKTKSKKKDVPDHIVFPDTIFSLNEKPVCSLEGHLDDILDLSWSSSSQYLLSSSMDKTVRMWDIANKSCMKMFAHNDYVTCVQFNPIDENYFMSGSLDSKVRIWSVPDRQVVDWTDLHEMVTSASYTPDANAALVGSQKGCCRFFTITDGKLNQKTQLDMKNKRKTAAKKITGFQFAPENPSEVLITSADSQIRVFDGVNMIHKFRGFRNTSSQIAASYTPDGRYVVAASEDSHVYIWKRETRAQSRSNVGGASPVPAPAPSGKAKRRATIYSHEHFYCKEVSVAIPWPGPTPTLPTSVGNSGRISNHSPEAVVCDDTSCSFTGAPLPPLPPNKKGNTNTSTNVNPKKEGSIGTDNSSKKDKGTNKNSKKESASDTTSKEDIGAGTGSEKETGTDTNSKDDSGVDTNSEMDTGTGTNNGSSSSQDPVNQSTTEHTRSESVSSSSPLTSVLSSPLNSILFSPIAEFGSWRKSVSTRVGANQDSAREGAWGLVVVTANMEGDIRVYQNFGLPVRLNRSIQLV